MIRKYIKLMRLFYAIPFTFGLLVIAAYITAGNLYPIRWPLTFASLSLLCIIAASYIFNDICDIEVDMINCPERPLPSGTANRKNAAVLATVIYIAGLALALAAGWHYFTVTAVVTAGLVFYCRFSKQLGIFKDIAVAFLMTSIYSLAFAVAPPAVSDHFKALYYFPIWLFLTAMGYEMLKDVRDIKGDTVHNGKGIIDPVNTRQWFLPLARQLVMTGALISLVPYLTNSCRLAYLPFSIIGIALAAYSFTKPPAIAVKYIYAEVFLITIGSLVDLLVYGP